MVGSRSYNASYTRVARSLDARFLGRAMSDAETTKSSSSLPAIGSYKLVQQLGSGGMSSVFRATHSETGHEVAVKVLPRSLAKNSTLLQRFLREAKNAESLEHPNIVSIYDRGCEQGRYYLVLEYVSGGDLHDRVRNHGPLGVLEAVDVIKAVCDGLSHAAGRGLIHRDVKPANLLLTPEGRVKIIDLGLALQVEEEDERVTRDGTTVGTVDYMAPEQARDSRATSVRSDIYSLGCTFYYLLTGSPPFPGGDLTEKLRRHAASPPPDVRALRPEVPEALARLIQKMMAKRPDARFQDHESVIAALAGITFDPSAAPSQPLYALIDDDDDDDADEAYTLRPPSSGRPSSRAGSGETPSPRKSSQGSGATFSELAALDDDTPASRRTPRRPPTPVEPAAAVDALIDDEEDDAEHAYAAGAQASGGGGTRTAGDDVSVRDWIIRGLMIGVAIVLLGLGVQQLIALQTAAPETPPETAEAENPDSSASQPDVASVPVAKPGGSTKPKAADVKPDNTKKEENPAPEVVWTEPADIERTLASITPLTAAQESRFLPDWAKQKNAAHAEGHVVTVARLVSAPTTDRVSSLALAFNQSGGTAELADDGPFFEHDLRVGSQPRVIRAKAGFRPIVVLDPPENDAFRTQSAFLQIDGGALTLEGIDIIINVKDPTRPHTLTSLFHCKGGELTLRDCTVTVVGDEKHPFTFVRLADSGGAASKPARVRLERTLVRGPALTAVDFADAAGEILVSRSALLCGDAPVFHLESPGAAGKITRRIWLDHDLIAARLPVLEMVGSGSASQAQPVGLKAIGCNFGRIEGGRPVGFLAVKDLTSAAPRSLIDWSGEANILFGWSAWLTVGPGSDAKVPGVVEAREAWPHGETDELTRMTAGAWPQTMSSGWYGPADLEAVAPELAPILQHVAAPSPFLAEKSFYSFARLPLAELKAATTAAAADTAPKMPSGMERTPMVIRQMASPTTESTLPQPKNSKGMVPGQLKPAGPASTPAPAPNAPPPLKPQEGVTDLTFDAQAAPLNGDLGQFLREKVTGKDRRVRIQAWGEGDKVMSPVRVPSGIAVELVVVPPKPGARPLVWTSPTGLVADALIDAQGSDLAFVNARFARDGTDRLKTLIRVDWGRLTLTNCWLRAPWDADAGGGRLVTFRAATTQPLPPRAGEATALPGGELPAARFVDCLLITGGTAVHAELGLGAVTLTNCAVAGRHDAIVLDPQNVSRSRFAADLWIDRCTIVSEHAFVRLGPWPGKAPGPDRPWLVSTNNSAFVDARPRGRPPRSAVMLRADVAGFAQGAVFWQSNRDAYEVPHFLGTDSTAVGTEVKTDVQRHWVDFWGKAHMLTVSGPLRTNPAGSGVLLVDRSNLDQIEPQDLALNPASPKAKYVGVDVKRLGLNPPPPPRTGRRN
jgi:serine/threonine-protein kinase